MMVKCLLQAAGSQDVQEAERVATEAAAGPSGDVQEAELAAQAAPPPAAPPPAPGASSKLSAKAQGKQTMASQ